MKILSMSGFVPEQVCDTVRFIGHNGDRSISHYCGYASDFISQVLEDDSIDGAVYPKSCDSCRVIGSYFSGSNKFLYQIPVPTGTESAAEEYLARSIEDYKAAIEDWYEIRITEVDIRERNRRINKRNIRIKECYDSLASIGYGRYLDSIHEMLGRPLLKQDLSAFEKKTDVVQGKKVYLVGSFLSDTGLAYSIERAGMKIIGDNLTESKRLFSRYVADDGGNIYLNIAKGILQDRPSPTQNRFRELIEGDLKEIRDKRIKGVIFIAQKYCEPYDYLYSVYKKAMEEQGIPMLKLTCTDSTDQGREELAIETFSEML